MDFGTWLATTPLGTAVKAGLAVMLTLIATDWVTDGVIAFDHWQTWLIAGVATAVPVVVNWLNGKDPRYGNGSDVSAE
jgi:hypothetical protein